MDERLHVLEKLNDAVQALTTGKGRIKERLSSAANAFHMLKQSDFPETHDFRLQFASLWNNLTAADGSGNSFVAAIEKMSEDKAALLALEILEITSQYDDFLKGKTVARDHLRGGGWQRAERAQKR